MAEIAKSILPSVFLTPFLPSSPASKPASDSVLKAAASAGSPARKPLPAEQLGIETGLVARVAGGERAIHAPADCLEIVVRGDHGLREVYLTLTPEHVNAGLRGRRQQDLAEQAAVERRIDEGHVIEGAHELGVGGGRHRVGHDHVGLVADAVAAHGQAEARHGAGAVQIEVGAPEPGKVGGPREQRPAAGDVGHQHQQPAAGRHERGERGLDGAAATVEQASLAAQRGDRRGSVGQRRPRQVGVGERLPELVAGDPLRARDDALALAQVGAGRRELERALHERLRPDHAVERVLHVGQRHVVPRAGPQLGDGRKAESHTRRRDAVEAHVALHVPPVAGEPAGADLGAVKQQQGPRVAEPVGLEEVELVGEAQRELVAGGDRLDGDEAAKVVGAEALVGVAGQCLGKARDVVGLEAQTTGRLVPTVGEQAVGAGRHAGQQIEGRDAAPRTFGDTIGLAEQDGGPAGLIDHARRDDADHALVPVGARQHDRGRQWIGQPRKGLAQDDRLDLLAFGVQLPETLGERQGRGAIGRPEELDRLGGVVEASGGVQSRRQAKADGRARRRRRAASRLSRAGRRDRAAARCAGDRCPSPPGCGSRRAASRRRRQCRPPPRRGTDAARAAARRGRRRAPAGARGRA